MLFDLRARGRRRTIQTIYLSLAVLMGGGLVLFGIGSDQGSGIVDGIIGDGSSSSATESIDNRIDAQLDRLRANPRDAAGFAQLAILRYQRAGITGVTETGEYTEDGKRRLGLAASAWQRHLALEPDEPNARAANLMSQAYSAQGLNDLPKAVQAKQIVTAAEDPPNSNQFAQLAQLAYQAGDTRVGDLAATRAVDLAPESDREALREALRALKAQGTAQAAPEPGPEPAGQ